MSHIKDALPPPSLCDVCCSLNIELTTNDRIYGRVYGNWPKIYYCNDCTAAVGCHPGTETPLGRMADKETRTLRNKAHSEFDKLWKEGLMPRSKAYEWLANQLGIDYSICHISWLSKDKLKEVVALSAEHFAKNHDALLRRKVKHNARKIERIRRTEAEQRRRKAARKP